MNTKTEMVIFTRTFDLLMWLVPMSNHFPRAHRHTLTQRLLNSAFDLQEHLETANLRKGRARVEQLQRADEALAKGLTFDENCMVKSLLIARGNSHARNCRMASPVG